MTGYYSFPTVYGDTIVFTCEDDLWSVSTEGGRAYRLTADVAAATNPRLSPDGQWLAFIGSTEGHGEVYVAPATGGEATRLTYFGATQCSVAGWHPQTGDIVFASDGRQPFFRLNVLYTIGRDGGEPVELPYGPANQITFGPGEDTVGPVVLGRNVGEPARWKRYRGGTAGDLWIDPTGGGDFHRLIKLNGNLASACWVGDAGLLPVRPRGRRQRLLVRAGRLRPAPAHRPRATTTRATSAATGRGWYTRPAPTCTCWIRASIRATSSRGRSTSRCRVPARSAAGGSSRRPAISTAPACIRTAAASR